MKFVARGNIFSVYIRSRVISNTHDSRSARVHCGTVWSASHVLIARAMKIAGVSWFMCMS